MSYVFISNVKFLDNNYLDGTVINNCCDSHENQWILNNSDMLMDFFSMKWQ